MGLIPKQVYVWFGHYQKRIVGTLIGILVFGFFGKPFARFLDSGGENPNVLASLVDLASTFSQYVLIIFAIIATIVIAISFIISKFFSSED